MINIVNANKNCPVIYVLNAFNRWKASSDFLDWLSHQVQNDILTIPQSELFVQASAYEKSIVDYAPKNRAATAIVELCNRVNNILRL